MSRKTVQSNDPWKPAQDYILQGLDNSGRVFDTTQPQLEGFAAQQRDTYGRVAPGAEAGISAAQRAVNSNISGENFGRNPGRSTYLGLSNFANPATGMFGAAADDNTANPAIGMIGQAMQGGNPAMSRTSMLGDGGFVGQGASADYWRRSLGGEFLNGDSNFNAVVGNTMDDVQRRVNAQFGGSGAVNQTAHSDLLARNLAATNASMRSQNFQQERARQDMAAGALDGATRGDRSQQLQALGMVGDMSSGSAARRLQAAGMTGDLYNTDQARRLQAMGLFGDSVRADAGLRMSAAGQLDRGFESDMARQQAGIGQAQDLMRGSQGLLDSAAQLPWYGVGALNGNVRQASNGYGTTTTQTNDPWGVATGILGAAASGASAYKSDPRVKNDLGVVGKRPDGLNLHKYVMKDDPTQTPKIGVMADEVAAVRPDALGPQVDGGVQTVDYGKLGMPGGPVDVEGLRQNVPTIEKPVDRSFGAVMGRLTNPDAKTPEGALGLFGQYLMANSGGPFESVGKGLIGARQEGFDRADTNRRLGIAETQAESLADWRGRPLPGSKPRIMQMRDGSVISVDPETNETVQISGPIAGPEPMVATTEGYVPRSQAAGKMPYRAPAAPRSPGRVQTKVIDGKAYYNVGGRWFDNPEGL